MATHQVRRLLVPSAAPPQQQEDGGGGGKSRVACLRGDLTSVAALTKNVFLGQCRPTKKKRQHPNFSLAIRFENPTLINEETMILSVLSIL